jgi:hypothetical protein
MIVLKHIASFTDFVKRRTTGQNYKRRPSHYFYETALNQQLRYSEYH